MPFELMSTKNRKMEKKSNYRITTKKGFLEGVKGRLENDVWPYFGCINQIYLDSGKKKMVGFWALARMVFPVIEAIAKAVY